LLRNIHKVEPSVSIYASKVILNLLKLPQTGLT
jgi:hypothetical protein